MMKMFYHQVESAMYWSEHNYKHLSLPLPFHIFRERLLESSVEEEKSALLNARTHVRVRENFSLLLEERS